MGSLSLTDEPARSATIAALDVAKAAGAVMSYDPNYRDSLWTSAEVASEQMRSIVTYMDLIKISCEETELLTGRSDPTEAARILLGQGARVVCVTLDDEGALVATKDGSATVPSFKVDAVDTTGAGDSFWGGFLCAFVDADIRPENVTLDDARSFARFGNAVASLCVRRRGAIPAMPTLDEVEKVLS